MTTKREDLPQSEQGQPKDKTGPYAGYTGTAPPNPADHPGPGPKGDMPKTLLGDDRPFDYIERTKPEDRLPPETARGQLTRDNVNPNIPSSPHGGDRGGLTDPKSLGMEQGTAGTAVPQAPKTTGTPPLAGTGSVASVNEPAGSTLGSNMDSEGKPIVGGEAPAMPVITELEPDECTIGDETFDIFVHGTGFTEDSVIVFAGQEEPTDLEDDGSLSTGINMDVWNGPDTVQVSVKNGDKMSNLMDFTFHAEPATRKAPPKPVKRKGKGVKAKKGKR